MKKLPTKPLPSQETLREQLDYDPDTGKLTWKKNGKPAGTNGRQLNGTPAGRLISVGWVRYKVNRIIWQLVYGSIPDGYVIDHINHDPWDDRLANLRACTHVQNKANRRLRPPKCTGCRGVRLNKKGRFIARLGMGSVGKRHIGVYDTLEEAAEAYKIAAAALYGEFLCLENL